MTDRLKPCPFCGGEAECHKWWSATISGDYATFCAECGCGTNYFKTEAEAIAAWNARYHCGLTDEDYNILLDELGVSERTCEVVNVNGYAFRFECSLCGYVAIVHNCDTRLDELPNYCPNCGAKVTKSDQDL